MAITPVIKAIGTATPPHCLTQSEIKQFVAQIFKDKLDNLDKLLPIFENSHIKTRYLAKPLNWYQEENSFPKMNEVFSEAALDLAEKACRRALEKANLKARDVGMVIFVSSTGLTTPTLDTKLIQELNLSPNVKRLPIWGLGCAGGVAGIARARELALTLPGKCVLLVAVELCSLTFQRNDFSKSNLVATSIFADGAAAAIIAAEGEGVALCGSHSTLFAGTEDIMGWDIVDKGFKVRFSRSIPALVERYLPIIITEAALSWGVGLDRIVHYVAHPGGAKVLTAYAESLRLNSGEFTHAYKTLEDYGNMSSVSVFFVLERFLNTTPASGDYGIMLALGPGFSAEQVLFRW